MINVNDFRPGTTFEMDDHIYLVIESQHAKVAMRQAHVKCKIKNLRSGSITTFTFTGGDKVKPAFIDKKEVQYLYSQGDSLVFMDNGDFSQIEVPAEYLADEKKYLVEGHNVKIRVYKNNEILGVELPDKVTLKVIETSDAVKGNSANNPTKEATLNTGLKIQVPMFVKENDDIIVNTVTGEYSSRA